jgi:hypothetical protein
LKVVSITGDTAQIEYSHNGHKEVGTANVDRNTITYGNVAIATRDGQQGALEFSFGIVRQAAVINKVTAPVDQNKLVGSWVGSSDTQSACFQVLSISSRDAQVRYNIDGQSGQGVGDVVNNSVLLAKYRSHPPMD